MGNREKIEYIIAKKLGLPVATVREAVNLQARLIRETMQTDKTKTAYFRKVGYFSHAELRYKLKGERIKRSEENKKSHLEHDDDNIIEFD
jgi:hypothetical protein